MATSNALLFELSSEKSIKDKVILAKQVLDSDVYIPRKTEIIFSWLYKSLQNTDAEAELTCLWKLTSEIILKVQRNQIAFLLHKEFIDHIKKRLNELKGSSLKFENHMLIAIRHLLNALPEHVVSLKLESLHSILEDLIKLFINRQKTDSSPDELLGTIHELVNQSSKCWCSSKSSLKGLMFQITSIIKPLLQLLMLLEDSSENLTKDIKALISAGLFHQKRIDTFRDFLSSFVSPEENSDNSKLTGMAEDMQNFKFKRNFRMSQNSRWTKNDAGFRNSTGHQNKEGTGNAEDTNIEENIMPSELQDLLLCIKKCNDWNLTSCFFAVMFDQFLVLQRTADIHYNFYMLVFVIKELGIVASKQEKAKLAMARSFRNEKIHHLYSILESYRKRKQFSTLLLSEDNVVDPVPFFGSILDYLINHQEQDKIWFLCMISLVGISPLIMEEGIIPILEKYWLTSYSSFSELSTVQEKLLVDIVNTYSRLYKLPKLIRKLSQTFKGESVNELSVEIGVNLQNSLTKAFSSLMPGQVSELWEFFLDYFNQSLKDSILENYNLQLWRSRLFGELFYLFLSHVQLHSGNLPASRVQKISHYMESLKHLAFSLFSDAVTAKHPLLCYISMLMIYSWGELHLMLKVYQRTYLPEWLLSADSVPEDPEDLSLIHSDMTKTVFEKIHHLARVDGYKKCLYLLLLLQVQKIKALYIFHINVSYKYLKHTAEYILQCLCLDTDQVANNLSWNKQIITILEDNWTVVSCYLLLTYSPFIIPYLSAKDQVHICSFLFEIYLEDSESDVSGVTPRKMVLEFLGSASFLERSSLHSAYISVLLGHMNKAVKFRKRKHDSSENDTMNLFTQLSSSHKMWHKQANTVPKVDRDHNSVATANLNDIWTLMHQASETLTEMMSSKTKANINWEALSMVAKAVLHLPLEYLSPTNQMRLLIGISAVLVSVKNSLKACPVLLWRDILKNFSKTFVALYNGTRKPWLHDFVNSGDLLIHVAKVFGNTFEEMEKYDSELEEYYCSLTNAVLDVSLSKIKSLKDLANTVPQAVKLLENSESFSLKTYATFNLLFLENLLKSLSREHMSDEHQNLLNETTFSLARALLSWMNQFSLADVASSELKQTIFSSSSLLIQFCFSLSSSYKPSVKKEIYSWLEVISEIVEEAVKDLFTSKGLKPSSEQLDLIGKAFQNRSQFPHFQSKNLALLWLSVLQAYLNCSASNRRLIDLEEPSQSVVPDQENVDQKTSAELELLTILFDSCKEKEHLEVMEKLLQKMKEDTLSRSNTVLYLQTWYCLFKSELLTNYDLSEDSAAISKIVHKLFYYIDSLDAKKDVKIWIYTLRIFASVLAMKKVLTNNHICNLILLICTSVPLKDITDDPLLYCSLFQAVYEVLNMFVLKKIHVVISYQPAFMPLLSIMLETLIRASNQDKLKVHGTGAQKSLQLCAIAFERLITVLCNYKQEFSKALPLLIDHYLGEVINITIHPAVKNNILYAVYKMLDASDPYVTSALLAAVPMGKKEIFQTLNEDFKKLKYRGKV